MSLERKIILSFLISFTLVALFAIAGAVTFVEIRREIAYLELSDTLRSKTLQLRRHEKNYFLYGERQERDNVVLYLNELRVILRAERPRYQTTDLAELERNTQEYRECFSRIEALAAAVRGELARIAPRFPEHAAFFPLMDAVILERPLVEAGVLAKLLPRETRGPVTANLEALHTEIGLLRKYGDEIITRSKNIDRAAREKADRALQRSQTAALVLFPLSILVGLGSLFIIGHSVVRRLKLLTGVIEQTGKGEFTSVALPEDADEIGVLVHAVNTMERELALRERELARKNEELHQGRKLAAIGTLASGVAHELNNPLNNISLSAQMLARQVDPATATPLVREIVGDILSQTQRVKRIVGDLLEFSREKPPDLKRVELAALLREIVAGMQSLGAPAGVAYRLASPEECWVLADPHLLTQVFVNLLSNAAEAMGEAGGSVSIVLAAADGASRIEIRDTGRGIHPDDQPKIFDPFFTTKEQGTGLGLAIVYNSVKKLGGAIDVHSELEKGTTFVITLPGAP
jgi:signal transduction histidine kinase